MSRFRLLAVFTFFAASLLVAASAAASCDMWLDFGQEIDRIAFDYCDTGAGGFSGRHSAFDDICEELNETMADWLEWGRVDGCLIYM